MIRRPRSRVPRIGRMRIESPDGEVIEVDAQVCGDCGFTFPDIWLYCPRCGANSLPGHEGERGPIGDPCGDDEEGEDPLG